MTEQQADEIISLLGSINRESSKNWSYSNDIENRIGELKDKVEKMEQLLDNIYDLLDERLPIRD